MILREINHAAENAVSDALGYCELYTNSESDYNTAALAVLHEVQERCTQQIALLQKAGNSELRFEASVDNRYEDGRLEKAAA